MEPITFHAPSFAIFDTERNGVCTTPLGNLAIFSTPGMAEIYRRKGEQAGMKLKVIPVLIKPTEIQ